MDYDINVKDNLKNYDIVFNCIKLHEDSSEVFKIDTSSKQLICDISCDYSKLNNPIKLYNKPGTWTNPIINVENIDILAIDNLPSLLPIESSEYFSSIFTDLLLNYNNEYWKNALNSFKLASK
jgi:saccharopine dehydrogenase (NAD+, L-lysine-forming)